MKQINYIRFLQVAVKFTEDADPQLGTGNLCEDENTAVN